MAKRDIKFLINDIQEATVYAAQEAAVNIMNSLAQAGPVWTGKFSSAWYAVPKGGSPSGPRSEGKVYKYDRRNVPATKFKSGTLYRIVNGMDYAAQAQDMDPFDPRKELTTGTIRPDKLRRGHRPTNGRRGELLDGSESNRATAPLDWYVTYINGGALHKDLGSGLKRGFGTFKPKGFGA